MASEKKIKKRMKDKKRVVSELPNVNYAYDDEDINNRVYAELEQQNESFYYFDADSNTFSTCNASGSNWQGTNFLVDLKNQWQIIIAPAVSNASSDIETVLKPIVKRIKVYIEWARDQAINLIGIRLLFPYNLKDRWHWNLGEINIHLDQNRVITSCEGTAHDPFGEGEFDSVLKYHLLILFQNIVGITQSNINLAKMSQFVKPRQTNGVYCGLVTARDLLRRIGDLCLDDDEYRKIFENEKKVRKEDFEVFLKYLNNEKKIEAFVSKQKEIRHSFQSQGQIDQDYSAQPLASTFDNNSTTYERDHLLAAGFSGSVYQLLVFINEFLMKMNDDRISDFRGMVEVKDRGNLDDIAFVITDTNDKPLRVEALQVKYYKNPITIKDFYNASKNSKNSNKDKKLNIGKFFHGWLKWKESFPKLQDQFKCVLFSNTSIDVSLKSCLEADGNTFKRLFINHRKIVLVPKKIPKNFLKEKCASTSEKIWQLLKEANYLDENDHFTKLSELSSSTFSLDLKSTELPCNITADDVLSRLKKIHVDFLKLLRDQAFEYTADFFLKHPDLDKGKLQLFRSFLKSLQLKIDQPKLKDLEKIILENLASVTCQKSDQVHGVYTCLYYAIQNWFVKDCPKRKAHPITKKDMNKFLSEAKAKSRDLLLLQGHTEACLSRISYLSREKFVPRDELPKILEAIKKPGCILITGRKGLGKSALVKQALELSQYQYLMLPAVDVNNDPNLRESLKSVIKFIQIIIFDSAELMFPLQEETKKFLQNIARLENKTIVFTVIPGDFSCQIKDIFPQSCKVFDIIVQPLSLNNVMQTYPELTSLKIRTFKCLAEIPFYLARLLTLFESYKFVSITSVDGSQLKAELIELDIERMGLGNSEQPLLAWRRLAFRIASTVRGLIEGVEYSEVTVGLSKLKENGVVYCKNNRYFFSHDLYFDHGLMSYWTQKWEFLYVEENTQEFWSSLLESLKSFGIQGKLLEDWLTLHLTKLHDDILQHISIISEKNYLKYVVTASILAQNNELFRSLVKGNKNELKGVFGKIGKHCNVTLILFAILENKPELLRLLLESGLYPHHPNAGKLSVSRKLVRSYYKSDGVKHEHTDDWWEHFDFDDTSEYGNNSFDSEYEDNDRGTLLYNYTSWIKKFCFNPVKYWPEVMEGDISFSSYDYDEISYFRRADNSLSYLHQAVEHGKTDCVEVLLDWYIKRNQSPVLNLQNRYNETPLHIAALKNSTEATKVLLEKGAEVDISDYWDESPLHNATYTGNVKIAKILLEHGANPNKGNKYGITPAHIAFVHLNIEMMELLLEHEAKLFYGVLNVPHFESHNWICLILDIFGWGLRFENIVKELLPILISTTQEDVVEVFVHFSLNVQILKLLLDSGNNSKVSSHEKWAEFIKSDSGLPHFKSELLKDVIVKREDYQKLESYVEQYTIQNALEYVGAYFHKDDNEFYYTKKFDTKVKAEAILDTLKIMAFNGETLTILIN